jgi:hypothetical protein
MFEIDNNSEPDSYCELAEASGWLSDNGRERYVVEITWIGSGECTSIGFDDKLFRSESSR